MKIHSLTFEPFVPSRLLIESKRDAYEANGHEFLAAAEAQHQTKLRSRQIAASAVRYQKEHTPQGTSIAETDMVKVIEILSTSLTRGTDHPAPFSDESLKDLQRILLSKKETTTSWEIALKGSLQAAEQELSFENFLLFDHWLQELLYFLRLGRVGAELQGQEAALAQSITSRFLAFCKNDEADTWDDQQGTSLQLMLEEFLKHFITLLTYPTDFELRFFLARFSAERLAVRHECSVQEWLFLFSNMEFVLSEKIKKADAYHLSRYFLLLQGMASTLTFSGLVLREFPKVQAKLADFQTKFEIDPKSLTQAALAEMLLDQPNTITRGAPLIPWAIVHGQSVFSKASGLSFHGAQRALCEALLQIAERNWIDLLSKPLVRMAQSAQWRDQRRASAQQLDKVAELTAKNLAEGLDSLASNSRLVPDLVALLDQSSLASLYFTSSHDSLSYLRHWFIFNIGANQIDHGWQHSRTIVRSLKTNFQQSDTSDSSQAAFLQGLENLNSIEGWIQDCRTCGTEAWPHATVHSLRLEKSIPEAACQRDALWILRRCLINTLHSGPRSAINLTLRWISEEIVPFAGSHRLSSYTETYSKLAHATGEHEVFKKNQTAQTMLSIVAQVDRAVLSFQLWEQSEALGLSAAQRIYEALPEYAEKARPESLPLCARDNCLILKRTALSLRPEIEDPEDFIGIWWHNIVSHYLTTKLPRLFQVQVKQLAAVVEHGLGSPGDSIVHALLAPVISASLTENNADVSTNRIFRFLPTRSAVDAFPALPQTTEHSSSVRFRSWFSGKVNAALNYAQQNPLLPLAESLGSSGITASELEAALHNGLEHFLSSGNLPTQATATAYRICAASTYKAASLERACTFLNSELALSKACADTPVWLSYLGAWIGWSRRARAALWLSENAQTVAEKALAYIHTEAPTAMQQGATAASSEKFVHDFRMILENLATLWQTESPHASLLHHRRYFLQLIAPYVGYGDLAWSMIWQAAAMQFRDSLDVGAKRFALNQLSELEKCATHFEVLQPISLRINGGTDSVFSPEEETEGRWRDAVNLLLALASLDPADEALRRTYTQAAVSACPIPLAEFGDRLDSVLSAFGEWFVEADLSALRRAVVALKLELEARKILSTIWPDLPNLSEKLKLVLQTPTVSESNDLLVGLVLDALKLQAIPNPTWGIPNYAPALAALPESCLDLLVTQPERFERAVLNLLGSRLGQGDAAAQAAKHFTAWASSLQVLAKNWQLTASLTSGKEYGELCLHNTHWLARRLALASIHEGADIENTLGWFSSEVLDFAEETDFFKIQTLSTQIAHELGAHSEASSSWKTASTLFSQALPRLLLARRLTGATALNWSNAAVDQVIFEKPHFSKNPHKCKRDTALALGALARSLEYGAHAPTAMDWWMKSVKPFLTTETIDSASTVHHYVLNVARPDLSQPEQTLLQEALAPFLTLKA